MRVTDEMVRSWLIWARNFEEIVSYRIGEGARRRFRVRLPLGVTRDGNPFRRREGMLDILGHREQDVVPMELMLTAREALVFGYGCAAGRAAALAGSDREWDREWTAEEREGFVAARRAARELDRAELDREMEEREEERLRRVAEHRRRREGTKQVEEDAGR